MARRNRWDGRHPYPPLVIRRKNPLTLASELHGGLAIVQYLNSISSEEKYDMAWFTKTYAKKIAKLQRVKTADLRPLVTGGTSNDLVKTYQSSPENRPPLFVDGRVIIDGRHRFMSALANGEKEIECYVVEDSEEPK